MTAITLQSFKDSVIAAMPALAADCVNRTRDALRHSSAELALAQDRARVFVVAETLLNHARHFETCLSKALQSELEGPGRRQEAAAKSLSLQLDDVGLVDEQQAETEIVLAQIVQMIDLKADWELRQMDAYMATLLQLPRGAPRAHAFQPARFAAALSASMATLGLGPDEKRLLLRVSGGVLAELLRGVYASACTTLQRAGVQPQPFRAKIERPVPTETAAPAAVPAPAPAPDVGASLHTLLQKFPASEPMAAEAAGAASSATGASTPANGLSITFKSIDLEPKDPSFVRAAPPATDAQVQAMLAALFKALGSDAQVPSTVKTLIGQLQPSLQKAARTDPSLLASTQHPAWRFINELAQQASGYAQTDAAVLQQLVAHAQPLVAELNRLGTVNRSAFEAATRSLQRFVEERSHQAWQHRAGALSSLQSADQRLTLEPVVRQQLVARLTGVSIDAKLREFLLGTWVRVLTQVLCEGKAEDPRTQSLLNTVEDLIQSVQPPHSPDDRARLKAGLPSLVQRLKDGMGRVAMPLPAQQALLDRLSQILSPHLNGPMGTAAVAANAPIRPVATVSSRTGDPWGTDDDDGDGGGWGALPSLGMETNIGALPTVPMDLGPANGPAGQVRGAVASTVAPAPPASPAEWAAALEVGAWCKLSWQGQWATAQLLWISSNREFLVFKHSQGLQLQSISRKALERLRAEGLATQLEDRKLVQRAMDSLLLQDI